ncbi:MAG: PorT family protein [Muribaculaceae bacterium]|jgi:long-subunit fatty acid transport protein|nr:PorT family protein [Muribaculaceae bacterium]
MKKVLTLIAAAILCMSASAQVQFGAKVGFDLTNFWGSDVEHGMKPSYQAGLVMEYKFNPNFAIAPEVVFASQGGKFKALDLNIFGLDVSKTVTYNTNYINIPVMFKYYVAPAFSIDFGPQLGINVYSKYSIEDVDKAVDIKDNTKDVDFGLGLGGTYNLTENAFVQARYTMGMTKVFDGDYNKEKNGNIQIAFGMKF